MTAPMTTPMPAAVAQAGAGTALRRSARRHDGVGRASLRSRLPSPEHGNFVDTGALHPVPVAQAGPGLLQMMGDVWQWTRSAYAPYPGFRAWGGAVGEYNAKFMANQFVLRGGSCATPRSHIRSSYRNFFPADARWQFTGLPLARDSG